MLRTFPPGGKEQEPSSLLPPLPILRTLLSRYRFAFPRLELRFQEGAFRFGIWIRALPPLYQEFALEIYPDPDPRLFPERKGPDLPLLLHLQQRVPPGVELLLCDREGRIREGTRTTLFLYRKGEFLFPKLPSLLRKEEWLSSSRKDGETEPELPQSPLPGMQRGYRVIPRYQGITQRLLKQALEAKGLYKEVPLFPQELFSHQVYCSNSLHGVAGVRRLAGIPLPEPVHLEALKEILHRALTS